METFLKIICIKVHTRNISNHLSRIYFRHYIQRQFTMVIKYCEHFVVVTQYLEVLQLKTTVTVCSSDNKKQILYNQMIFIDKKILTPNDLI